MNQNDTLARQVRLAARKKYQMRCREVAETIDFSKIKDEVVAAMTKAVEESAEVCFVTDACRLDASCPIYTYSIISDILKEHNRVFIGLDEPFNREADVLVDLIYSRPTNEELEVVRVYIAEAGLGDIECST